MTALSPDAGIDVLGASVPGVETAVVKSGTFELGPYPTYETIVTSLV
jgi:hypothetical protein